MFTQVPQFILDHFIEEGKGSHCRIVCTQPRRISAISVGGETQFHFFAFFCYVIGIIFYCILFQQISHEDIGFAV